MPALGRRIGSAAVALLVVCGTAYRADAQTVIYVTTRNNCAGCGSLRDAINLANALPASEPVTIDMSPVGFGTVSRTSSLPVISRPVLITGPGAGILFVGAPLSLQADAGSSSTFTGFTFGSVRLGVIGGTLLIPSGNNGMFDHTTINVSEALPGSARTGGHIIINGTQYLEWLGVRGLLSLGDQADVTVRAGMITGRPVTLPQFDSIIRKVSTGTLSFDLGSTGTLGPGGRIFVDEGTVEVIDGELRSAFVITSSLHLRSTGGQQLVLSQLNGTGVVHKYGAGETFLGNTGTADNFFGSVVVHEGVLAGWSSTITGDIINNATVKFVQDYEIRSAGNYDGTYAHDMSGTGMLVKTGRGALILTGANTYTGGTLVTQGTLAGNTTSLQGNIVNDAHVRFDQQVEGVYAGSMSGIGSLTKSGSGMLTLTGANSYTGSTTVAAGTLRLGSAGAIGSGPAQIAGTLDLNGHATSLAGINGDGEISLAGAPLTVGWNNSSSSFEGVIKGSGSLTKTGEGELVLGGANAYTGGTFVAGGILQISSDANLGAPGGTLTFTGGTLRLAGAMSSTRAIVFGSSGTIDTNGFSATLAGALSGAGGLTKTGHGRLFLSGVSFYTGGTTVSAGSLAGTTNSLTGNILNNSLIEFEQAFDGVFNGTISGTGSLLKLGAGHLTLGGSQHHRGLTDVTGGGLVLGGNLAGSLVLRNGTLLRVANAVAIGGDVWFTRGSTYQVPLDASLRAPLLDVSGTAAIDGAALQLLIEQPVPAPPRVSTTLLLRASDIQGRFGEVSGAAGFDAFQLVRNRELWLLLIRRAVDFGALAASRNGDAVAAALMSVKADAGSDLSNVLRELRALDTDQEIGAALDAIGGREHSSGMGLSLLNAQILSDVVSDRFTRGRGPWLRAFGSRLRLGDRVDATAPSATTLGSLAGFDGRVGSRIAVGVAGGYSDQDVPGRGSNRVDGRSYHGAAYGGIDAGPLFAQSIVAVSAERRRVVRHMSFTARLDGDVLFGGVDRLASADYDALQTMALVDAGLRVEAGRLLLRPAAGVQVVRLAREAFNESGADGLNLASSRQSVESQSARLRLEGAWRFGRLQSTFALRYARELGSRDVPVTASIGGSPFTISAFQLPRETFAGQAGFRVPAGRAVLSLDYTFTSALDQRQHLLAVGVGR